MSGVKPHHILLSGQCIASDLKPNPLPGREGDKIKGADGGITGHVLGLTTLDTFDLIEVLVEGIDQRNIVTPHNTDFSGVKTHHILLSGSVGASIWFQSLL
jgi:penicillin V acylase-like amidase (Ntn superfamily)